MKNKLIIVAAVAAFFAPQAFAQAANFQGFSLGGNVAMAKTKVDYVGTGLGATSSASTSGLDLQLQYSVALGDKFLLGFGATMGGGSNQAGTVDVTTTTTTVIPQTDPSAPIQTVSTFSTKTIEFNTKSRTSFELMPAYAISDTVLVFAKLSSLSATAVAVTNGVESTETMSGMGYGVGLRTMFDKNMFFQIGYDTNKYEEKGNAAVLAAQSSSTVFNIGVGYKF